jgi:hypothetical protein
MINTTREIVINLTTKTSNKPFVRRANKFLFMFLVIIGLILINISFFLRPISVEVTIFGFLFLFASLFAWYWGSRHVVSLQLNDSGVSIETITSIYNLPASCINELILKRSKLYRDQLYVFTIKKLSTKSKLNFWLNPNSIREVAPKYFEATLMDALLIYKSTVIKRAP